MNRPDSVMVEVLDEDEYVRLDEHEELVKYCDQIEIDNKMLKKCIKDLLKERGIEVPD